MPDGIRSGRNGAEASLRGGLPAFPKLCFGSDGIGQAMRHQPWKVGINGSENRFRQDFSGRKTKAFERRRLYICDAWEMPKITWSMSHLVCA